MSGDLLFHKGAQAYIKKLAKQAAKKYWNPINLICGAGSEISRVLDGFNRPFYFEDGLRITTTEGYKLSFAAINYHAALCNRFFPPNVCAISYGAKENADDAFRRLAKTDQYDRHVVLTKSKRPKKFDFPVEIVHFK